MAIVRYTGREYTTTRSDGRKEMNREYEDENGRIKYEKFIVSSPSADAGPAAPVVSKPQAKKPLVTYNDPNFESAFQQAFGQESAENQAYIRQNLDSVIQTGPNAGVTFRQLMSGETTPTETALVKTTAADITDSDTSPNGEGADGESIAEQLMQIIGLDTESLRLDALRLDELVESGAFSREQAMRLFGLQEQELDELLRQGEFQRQIEQRRFGLEERQVAEMEQVGGWGRAMENLQFLAGLGSNPATIGTLLTLATTPRGQSALQAITGGEPIQGVNLPDVSGSALFAQLGGFGASGQVPTEGQAGATSMSEIGTNLATPGRFSFQGFEALKRQSPSAAQGLLSLVPALTGLPIEDFLARESEMSLPRTKGFGRTARLVDLVR